MAVHLFHYPEGGAPFPGKCAKCGDFRDLYDIQVEVLDGSGLLCRRCISDLATNIGWVEPTELNLEIAHLTLALGAAEHSLERIPNHAEELINGIRSSVADFVLSISSSSDDSSSVSVQGDVNSPEATADNFKSAASNSKAPRKPASH